MAIDHPKSKMGRIRLTPFKRRIFFLLADSILIAFSIYVSFWLRFDGAILSDYLSNMPVYIGLFLAVKLSFLAVFGMYNITWRFFGLTDLIKLVSAVTAASCALAAVFLSFRTRQPFAAFPRGVMLADYLVTLGLLGGLRISKRVVVEHFSQMGKLTHGRTRILIVGAGAAGSSIGREMLINKRSKFFPVGYIDDDVSKKGMTLQGIKVLGTREDIPALLKASVIDEVLIAIPAARSKEIRDLVEIARNSGGRTRIKILPGILDIMDGNVTLSDIKEVRVEDLLGREKVEIDRGAVWGFLSGKRVLITGAGGSIGSEIARTVLQFDPGSTALLEIDETELFNLMNRFQGLERDIVPVIADIRDRAKMEEVFANFRPEILLHAAAYKHVPLLESNPGEAVKTNVMGTKILSEMALKFNVGKFILISTDKAINPTSVMGSTKRVGEEMLRALNGRRETKFISVRFGNVLGSRGSVIPIFEDQIKRGGPVTVTHPDMKRYFMATSEAVLLVLEAAAIGSGGETFILDMGEPVKIVDLAREMIRLSGYHPDVDIPVVFSGLRPGEKLFEELLDAEEGSEPTEHPRIFVARNSLKSPAGEIFSKVEDLIRLCYEGGGRKPIVDALADIVPTYRPQGRETGSATEAGSPQ